MPGAEPTDEQLRAGLAAAGERLAAADAERAAAMEQVRLAVVASHGRVPVAEQARLAHVTRPTVYALAGRLG